MKHILLPLAITLAAACAQTLAASKVIDVIKTGATKSRIDLSQLSTIDGKAAATFKDVLQADLRRSGWFEIRPATHAAFIVEGSCEEADRSLQVKYRVYNAATRKVYLSKSFRETVANSRKLAHNVADTIVLAVKRCPGIASTRIVMVGTGSGSKEIYICDANGYNLKRMTDDKSISVAPSWNADGTAVVYTSFRTTFPYIYQIDLFADPLAPKRKRITSFPGLNVCAAISPDGNTMALSLSKDGNPDLYAMNLKSNRLRRLTRTRNAGEASPSWAPDGKQIVFVSDSSGRPNLYTAHWDGADRQRITFHGTENVSPDWGPNGLIAYSSRCNGHYQICVIDPATGEHWQLTRDPTDHEDPSWAPDGRHIAYAQTARYHSDVYILDTMGDDRIRLTTGKGNWYSPAWSPK